MYMEDNKINGLKNGDIPIDLIDKSAIRIPDGIGIVWAIHKIFSISIERLTGVDLFLDFLDFADKNKKSIFIYAGKDEVIKKAVRFIERKYKFSHDIRLILYFKSCHSLMRRMGVCHQMSDEGTMDVLKNYDSTHFFVEIADKLYAIHNS